MKVKDILDQLKDCDPESDVHFMTSTLTDFTLLKSAVYYDAGKSVYYAQPKDGATACPVLVFQEQIKVK